MVEEALAHAKSVLEDERKQMQGQLRGMMREAYKKGLRDHSIVRYSEAALDTLAKAAFPDA